MGLKVLHWVLYRCGERPSCRYAVVDRAVPTPGVTRGLGYISARVWEPVVRLHNELSEFLCSS